MYFDSLSLIDEALSDLEKLDRGIQKMAIKKLRQLENNHSLGKPLGKVGNRDLSGFYKIYFNNKRHRIVYRIVNKTVEIAGIHTVNDSINSEGLKEIVEVFGIGKRDGFEVYDDVLKRYLQKSDDSPHMN